jgi:hypothetical protein
VAPTSPEVTLSYPDIAGFVAPIDPAAVWAASRRDVRLVATDHDVYSTEGTAHALYGVPLGLDSEVLPAGGHFTIGDGFGPWPVVLSWCLDPSTRFAGRP